jgi:RNA polymerase sigma-70 factor (ECF subfamily)
LEALPFADESGNKTPANGVIHMKRPGSTIMAALVPMEVQEPAVVSDEALVDRLRGGDASAGHQLVQRHCRALLRYLQRLVGNEELAEELHQQTWLSVVDHLDRFDATGKSSASAPPGGGFKAWLYRIATNKANDYWRFRTREKTMKEGVRLASELEGPDASLPLENAEQAAKLKKAIDRLPENQRQVLLLRYYSGLKFVEIAQSLGCPLNTALGRMHKAIMKLKQLMEEPET